MREVIAIAAVVVVLSFAYAAAANDAGAPDATHGPMPAQALARLTEGNGRFVAGESTHPNIDEDRRCLTNAGQHPFATILSCSDSRAPVELLFDQGVGDLFTVRVAGNVSDTDEIATIEYGVGHLHTPLVVVLGHTKCGAVTAVVDGASLHGNLALLTDNIKPAAEKARHDHPQLAGAPLISQAIKANVYQSIADLLANSEEVRADVEAGKVQVVGAVYDIHSGVVQWLGEHPQQTALLNGQTKPAETQQDNHAAPSSEHGEATHEPSHEAQSDASDLQAKKPLVASQEYMILAAFLAGSGTASGLVLRMMKKRQKDSE